MDNKIKKALENFIDDEQSLNDKVIEQKKKIIKSDKTIFERIDKQIIMEDGRQLLSE